MYGYEITREVERLTEGKIQLSWGALYPALHKLEADHLITSEEESIGNRVRKYYRLTESGTSAAREKVREFVDFVAMDYHLAPDSPAINAGIPLGVQQDFDGVSRPQLGQYDVGAFEAMVKATPTPIPTPTPTKCWRIYLPLLHLTGHEPLPSSSFRHARR